VQPAAVEAVVLASEEEARKRDDVLQALRRDLEAARYSAGRAQKQYDAADPENRLVSDELERRWNRALEHVRELEQRIDELNGEEPNTEPLTGDEFVGLDDELEAVWNGPQANARLKKR